jgi:hypothetical protein
VAIVVFPITLAELWDKFAPKLVNPYIPAIRVGRASPSVYRPLPRPQRAARGLWRRGDCDGCDDRVGCSEQDPKTISGLIQGIALAGAVYAIVSGIDDLVMGRAEWKKPILRR